MKPNEAEGADMNDNDEYTIDELLEEAKNDPSWEPDAVKRATLVAQLKRELSHV